MGESAAGNGEGEQVERAEVLRELGPWPDMAHAAGVTYDGEHVWVASCDALHALDPETGRRARRLAVAGDAGTAFDGRHIFQLQGDVIVKIDPESGRTLATIPAPSGGRATGLAWAEGSLWVGQLHGRCIHELDPESGAILRTICSNRFVTGVTWVDGELWHGTWEDGESEIRRVDPGDGRVLVRLTMPEGAGVSGLESDGGELFFAGGGKSGTVRVVRGRKRAAGK